MGYRPQGCKESHRTERLTIKNKLLTPLLVGWIHPFFLSPSLPPFLLPSFSLFVRGVEFCGL